MRDFSRLRCPPPVSHYVAAVLALSVGAACGEATDETTFSSAASSEVQAVSFVTFNTALGVGLADFPAQRLVAIQEALPALGGDVLCLQEVWGYDDTLQLVEGMAETHPYAHYSVTSSEEGNSGPACLRSEADVLNTCLVDNCADRLASALCAVTFCADAFASVEETCRACVVANQTEEPAEITRICSSGDAGVTAYSEQNGLVLLSSLPLTNLQFSPMDSALGDRGILAATLAAGGGVEIETLCSHLTPAFTDLSYGGEHDSWEGEREHHIQRLLQLAESRSEGAPTVLLGDMNCGPETESTPGVGPAAFAAFEEAGYESPYAQMAQPGCTFCSDNPLGSGEGERGGDFGAIIDHVLISGFDSTWGRRPARVLDEEIQVDVEGVVQATAYSDHYGVRLQLVPPESTGP